ncbi:MAG: hypothetical protein D6719_11930 [Candidatus Dadabacteria bacterium]|nr:MAG: hypothetical protein D6719_11930 [Candidatus Dadabacteria bacterium]
MTNCKNALKGALCLFFLFISSILQAAEAEQYTYFWVPETSGWSFNAYGGRVNYIDSSFKNDSGSYTFSWRVNFKKKEAGDVLADGFTLVINDGPNPKGIPNELAIFYFDASDISNPKLLVYGYNGKNNNRSYKDGNGDGTYGDPDKILSSLVDNSFVKSLTAQDELDGTRTLGFNIDATAIMTHTPLHGPASDWYGTGYNDTVGIWFHPYQGLNNTYSNGWLTDWDGPRHGWYDTNYQCSEKDDSGAVCTREYPPCENPLKIDFNSLQSGEVVTDQFSDIGVFSAINNKEGHPNKAIIFDSSNPTGGDDDLGTPNEAFGGPGQGSGYGAGARNETSLGKILIIAEDDVDSDNDGFVDDPDDEAKGGCFRIDFDEATEVSSLKLVDLERGTGAVIRGLDGSDNEVYSKSVEGIGDNSVIQSTFESLGDTSKVQALEICLDTSGAIDDLEVCQCNPDVCGDCTTDPNYNGPTCLDCAEEPNGGHVNDQFGGCCLPEEIDECGKCFGNNECQNPCPEGEDQCGVCGGDGTSCLGCESFDITNDLVVMDGFPKKQESIIKRVSRIMKRKARKSGRRLSKKLEKRIEDILAEAHELQIRNWTITWQIPSIINNCTNEVLCLASDHSQIFTEYHEKTDQLKDLTKKIIKLYRKFFNSRKGLKKLLKKSRDLAEQAHAHADTIPRTTDTCGVSNGGGGLL